MSKKLNWLDKFAEDQAAKMKKVASTTKVAEGEGSDVIVSPEDVPGAADGATVEYNGEQFQVVNANYSDDFGAGVVLRAAAYEGLEGDPMAVSMGAPASSVTTPSSQGQQYHYTKNDIQQTYDFDQDAQWGSSSAAATEQEIAGENATDRTTVPGHYTKSPGLNTSTPAVQMPVDGGAVPAQAPMAQTPVQPVVEPSAQPAAQAPVVQEPVQEPVQPSQDAQTPTEPAQGEEEVKEEDKTANRILARIRAKQG